MVKSFGDVLLETLKMWERVGRKSGVEKSCGKIVKIAGNGLASADGMGIAVGNWVQKRGGFAGLEKKKKGMEKFLVWELA